MTGLCPDDPIHPIAAAKRIVVLEALRAVESEHAVAVLFACESGSRGWGFASPDSDYDVRFIYAHTRDWYLTVDEQTRPGQPQRDVIELPIADDLDVSGWDLRKALRLVGKSNPTLLEWLRSPVVYRQEDIARDALARVAHRFYSPVAAFHHYLSMAKGNYRGYLRGERIRTKKYLYVLRPLLACQWILASVQPPPMAFESLLDALVPTGSVREAIDGLLAGKRASAEISDGPPIPEISRYLDSTLAMVENAVPPLPAGLPSQRELDDCFRRLLQAR